MEAPLPRPPPAEAAPVVRSPRPRSAWRGFTGSFRYAWDGIVETALRQRNMRIHLVAALWVGLLGAAVPLGVTERIALVLCVFLVLSAEVTNSALEALVDLVTRERDERARIAKDAGAGAVLILATCAVAVLAVVLLHAAPILRAAWPALWRQALLGAGVSVAMAGLLTDWRRDRVVDVLLSLAGAALLVLASLHTRSALFTCLTVLAFGVAVAVAAARRRAAGVTVAGSIR